MNEPQKARLQARPSLIKRSTIVQIAPEVRAVQEHKGQQVTTPRTLVTQPLPKKPIVTQPLPTQAQVAKSQVAQPQSHTANGNRAKGPEQPIPVGGLRPQPLPSRVQINYVPHPTPPGQTDRIKRIQGTGQGKALIIIGNGPSISEAPLELLRDHHKIDLMSINKPDPRLWPTQLWAFCDPSQYNRHEALWREYHGIIINSTAIYQQRPGTIQINSIQGQGFSRDLTKGFYIGRSTVYTNLQTAMWMGYDHVFVFGCDMCEIDGKMWFYGHNPDAPATMRKDRFKLEAEHYAYAAKELASEERSKYTFCSSYNPWEFVKYFNQLDHRLAVQEILAKYGY